MQSDALAGLCAGAASTILMHPLDLIKTQMQVGTATGLRHAMSDLTRANAYRGLTPNLVGNMTAWGAYYGIYTKLQEALTPYISKGPLFYWTSSVTAGLTTSWVTTPIWVIKTHILGSNASSNATVRSTVLKIWKAHGLPGFWRGFTVSIFGVLQSSVHFMIYDTLKSKIQDPSPLQFLATSAVSKTVAAMLFYPHQVIKSQMQYAHKPFIQTIMTIWNRAGPRGFYVGLLPALARVVPAMCITQVTYEMVRKWENTHSNTSMH